MQIISEALTFDDVLLVPRYSDILPKDASLKTQLTREIQLNIPILSAAMDTVTEHRLAVCLAEEGGLGILHKNMSIEQQAREVRKVKKFESGVVKDPITVSPNTTIRELIEITEKNNISGMPVVEGKKLVGIVTSRDIRFENNFDNLVANVMTPKARLITVKEGVLRDDVMKLFRQHRVEKILMVNDAFELRGMYTVKDILKSQTKPLATKKKRIRINKSLAVILQLRMQRLHWQKRVWMRLKWGWVLDRFAQRVLLLVSVCHKFPQLRMSFQLLKTSIFL
jgi:IMP dehydrogenase